MKKKDYPAQIRKDITKVSQWFLSLFLVIFPLAVIDYGNITATKYITFLALAGVFFFACLFSFGGTLLDGYRPVIRLEKSFFKKPEFFLLLYVLAGVLSFVFSPYKDLKNNSGQAVFWFGSGRYDGFILLVMYAALFYLLSNFGNFEKGHILLIGIVTIAMCIVAVVQLCGVNVFALYPKFNGKITKFISTIGNIDMFSGLMCVFIPIVVTAYLVLDNSKIANIALLTAQVLSIYTVLELGVSSGKLALFVTMLILLPFMFRDEKRLFKLADFMAVLAFTLFLHRFIEYKYIKALEKTQIQIVFDSVSGILLLLGAVLLAIRCILHRLYTRRKLTVPVLRGITIGEIVIPALLIAAISFSLIPIGAEGELGKLNLDIIGGASLQEEIADLFAGKLTDASGTYRIGIWRNALQMGLKRPVFGTGIGTFLEAFKTYADKAGLTERLGLIDTAHNEYLQLFCTVGLFGLVPYLIFLVLLAVKSFRRIFKDPYVLILGAAVLCYCVQAFFSFSVVIIAPYFWICMGLLNSRIKQGEMKNDKQQ